MKLMNHSDPLERLLISAGYNVKNNWRVYELYKHQISEMSLPADEYSQVIKKLSDILEV